MKLRSTQLFRPLGGAIVAGSLLGTSAYGQNPAHRFSFTDLTDSVGGAAVTLNGAAALNSGSLDLPGNATPRTDYADVSVGETIGANPSLTVEAWFTQDAERDWAKLFMFGNGTQNFVNITPHVGLASGVSSGELTINDVQAPTRDGAGAITLTDRLGDEVHAVVTYDSNFNSGVAGQPNGLVSLYIDGALTGTASYTGAVSDIGVTTLNYLGAAVGFGDPDFEGSINELRIWDDSMPAGFVADNFNLGPEVVGVRDPYLRVPTTGFNLEVDFTPQVLEVPIDNRGTTTINVSDLTLSNVTAGAFTFVDDSDFSLAAGESGTIQIAFDANNQAGEYIADLSFASNDEYVPTNLVLFTVTAGTPNIGQATPSTFGPVDFNSGPATYALTFENTGATDLVIDRATLLGSDTVPRFAPTYGDRFVLNTVVDLENQLTVAPGETGSLELSFDPVGLTDGTKRASIELLTNDTTTTLGNGLFTIPVTIEVTGNPDVGAGPTLVHRYSFANDGSTLAVDSVGGADGTLVGGTIAVGNFASTGGAVRTEYVDLPIGETLAGAHSLTVETFFQVNTLADFAKVWMFGTPSESGEDSVYMDYTPRAGGEGSTTSTSIRTVPTLEVNTRGDDNPAALVAGTAYHAVSVYDSVNNVLNLYLNGALVDSTEWNDLVGDLGVTEENFLSAAVFYNDSDFDGLNSEQRVWVGALNAAQVQSSFQNGTEVLPDLNAVLSADIVIGNVSVTGGNVVLGDVTGLQADLPYYLETSSDLQSFTPQASSQFQGSEAIPTVPVSGDRLFVRIVQGTLP